MSPAAKILCPAVFSSENGRARGAESLSENKAIRERRGKTETLAISPTEHSVSMEFPQTLIINRTLLFVGVDSYRVNFIAIGLGVNRT